MRRRAFTLIELLVIVAIIGIMAATAVLGVAAGQKAVRVRGATRDVFAAVRQARSTALVTQRPVIINYATEIDDGEPVAKIEIVSDKLMDTQKDKSNLQTVTGEPVKGADDDASRASDAKRGSKDGEEDVDKDKDAGLSVEEILFAPVAEEVVRGMRLKVLRGDESLEPSAAAAPRKKLSIFSNVDYLLSRYKDARAEAAKEKEAEKKKSESSGSGSEAAPAEEEEPVSIVWETNGRVEPHKVWVYPDGARPEDGLCIKVDAFGGAKVVSGDERE